MNLNKRIGATKKISHTILLNIFLFSGIIFGGQIEKIDPLIWQELRQNQETRFIVRLKEKADLRNASFMHDWNKRGEYVYQVLAGTAAKSQAPLLDLLNKKISEGSRFDYTSYWICNCLAVTADATTLQEIAARTDVERIVANRQMQVLEPAEIVESSAAPLAVEWNIATVRADEVWSTYGITGNGITIGSMDTGVEWTHPALQSKYRGWNDGEPNHNYNWFDATPIGGRVPYDSETHGTHTMGTIVGDDGAGRQIGVAPGAKWIAALIIGSDLSTWIEAAHRGFQWMLAPTDLEGQNPDPSKRPAVVNNSWGCANFLTACSEEDEFWDDVDAWLAVGIFPEFSAGNEGPTARSLRWPADYGQSFATGATDRNDVIIEISSRGPSRTDESIKPNVSAPGDDVRSSLVGGRYGLMRGTSMAGPHVVGLVALLLEADPSLTVEDLKNIIQSTALPLGGEVPNNTYGWGRIDAFNAVSAALGLVP